ncbi:J domain-containing protein [Bacillus mycoides]|uniref:Tetratricopeptide repeat protein n=1 Tax=Bacillus mycoides TaxID=1405 RepID=A0ABX6Z0G9_BACMY|nr:J domain-containing protein [Bacillus mycoides]AJH16922.1 tetratricopeptide repeat family protein [Bacillus mycoides]MDR4239389.1 tetratricopeptide repeat protein [Bacillus mycoides]MED1431000.1 tetratricopeptide repeat protein [Bacillus mycoides]MED1485584.1 tetratricopeptide repeat protein [Bacillus mycoides]QQA13578.1 tetratricopeptide repeat protein [Bacillus mycoides]
MSIWETLEIEPTDNIAAIKKAYAKLLKIYHPEDDPEGYQRLREAFDKAIKSAKQMKNAPPSQLEKTDENEGNSYIHPVSPTWMDGDVELTTTLVSEHPVHAFTEKIETLYNDFFARIEPKNWEDLLSSDVIWDVEHAAVIQDILIEFLQYHYHFPRSIWELLDNVFRFSEQREELEFEYGEETVQFLLERMSGEKEMRYDIFKKSDDLDFEAYFHLREEVQLTLMNNNLEAAKSALDFAYELYQEDPELLRMQGIYYLRSENKERALQSFNDILVICPDDLDGLLYRAQIYYDRGQFADAIKDCEHLLSIEPEHMDAQFLLVKYSFESGDIETVATRGLDVVKRYTERFEFRSYSIRIHTEIPEKRQKQEINTKFIIHYALYLLFIFISRTWVYLIFMILIVLTPLPSKYALLLLLPLIWEAWKFVRLKTLA